MRTWLRVGACALAALVAVIVAAPASAQVGAPPTVVFVDPPRVERTISPGESVQVRGRADVTFGVPPERTTVTASSTCSNPFVVAVAVAFDFGSTLPPPPPGQFTDRALFTETITVFSGTPAGTYTCIVVFSAYDEPGGDPNRRREVWAIHSSSRSPSPAAGTYGLHPSK